MSTVGLVISVDMELGPDGSLQGMHVGLASVGIAPSSTDAQRIGEGVTRVVEDVLFGPDVVEINRA